MIIQEQTWERKNLGIISAEIKFNNKDSFNKHEFNTLNLNKYDYLLVRVPVGRMDIAYSLQKEGFSFAETSLKLSSSLKSLTLPKMFESYEDEISINKAKEHELEIIYTKIQEGIFDTDKIALDPKFGLKKSSNRFYNWCKTEVENKTSEAYIVKYAEEKIGFFILKNENSNYSNSLLAGLFDKEKNTGLGYAVLYHPMLKAKQEGKKKIITNVSSNNLPSIKMHLALGYEIKAMNYVFIKHQKN